MLRHQAETNIGGADKNQEVTPEINNTEIKQGTDKEKIVVIDAGHGGMDEGTSSQDKNITKKNIRF